LATFHPHYSILCILSKIVTATAMLIRMESGRFKVFKHLNDWFDEFRLYHRKDGKVHKEGDDLMSATRYAVMMLRHARTAEAYNRFYRKIEYRKLEII
jgi:Terminase RNaseH-like domain